MVYYTNLLYRLCIVNIVLKYPDSLLREDEESWPPGRPRDGEHGAAVRDLVVLVHGRVGKPRGQPARGLLAARGCRPQLLVKAPRGLHVGKVAVVAEEHAVGRRSSNLRHMCLRMRRAGVTHLFSKEIKSPPHTPGGGC